MSQTVLPSRPPVVRSHGPRAEVQVQLARIPFPYRAMLAICSDLDETPSLNTYIEIARYLNTKQKTPMGSGLGLEVGNTIYFDMPAGHLSYWSETDRGRTLLRDLIHSGHIDCIHSFGDLAITRDHARRALDELARYDCNIRVWVDHATAISNLGKDIMRGRGDDPGGPVYHADLIHDFGIRYIWRGRVTSIIGQNTPRRFGGLFDSKHSTESLRTIAKECVKGVCGLFGSDKYSMHTTNRLTRVVQFEKGRRFIEFLRCDPFWGGVGRAATADGMAYVVTNRFLQTLIDREGIGILYTHLGKVRNSNMPFGPETCRAFERLAHRYESGDVLVLTTTRLLEYVTIRESIRWRHIQRDDHVEIELTDVDDPLLGRRAPNADELAGLSFLVSGSSIATIRLASGKLVDHHCSPTRDGCCVQVKIPRLEFPVDITEGLARHDSEHSS